MPRSLRNTQKSMKTKPVTNKFDLYKLQSYLQLKVPQHKYECNDWEGLDIKFNTSPKLVGTLDEHGNLYLSSYMEENPLTLQMIVALNDVAQVLLNSHDLIKLNILSQS